MLCREPCQRFKDGGLCGCRRVIQYEKTILTAINGLKIVVLFLLLVAVVISVMFL